MLHSINPFYFIHFSPLLYRLLYRMEGLMIAKIKNVILHEVLYRHFVVRIKEYHDWPETQC
jgi:hypothetical protein